MKQQQTQSTTDQWLTPPCIITALGEFDLDPCSPIIRPWDTAKHHFNIENDGLLLPWFGRVWLNPPYGSQLPHWLNRLALHGNGIALTFARTDTKAFFNYVFPFADSILFLRGRIAFLNVDGSQSGRAGAPSVLISYGEYNSDALHGSGIPGHHILLNRVAIVIAGIDATWKVIVRTVLSRMDEASLQKIYQEVESMAPERIRKNKHYKAKVRQTLQMHFKNVRKGIWSHVP